MTDNELRDRAITFVLAMMRSASTKKIDPKKWWERAKTALETGAAIAGSFAEMVSVMAAKLEIEVTSNDTATTIEQLATAVGSDGDFEGFRQLCEDQAVFIVAMAQAHREEQRQEQAQQGWSFTEVSQ